MGQRRSRLVVAGSAGLVVVVTNLGAVALNAAAASLTRWPGWLDVIRQYPFGAAGALTLGAVVATGCMVWWQEKPVAKTDGQRLPKVSTEVRNALPRDVAMFTGRADDLARVVTLARHAAAGEGVLAVHAIDGMAGIGKTALVIHAGHLLTDMFPDGQLFIDLYAHTAGQTPLAASDALATLLIADGMAPQLLPATLEARATLWRSRLAGKKVLLVLDNAASHEQVSPLLPGTGGSLVLVTSRRRLAALDAVALALDTLPAEEASSLFIRLAGRDSSAMDTTRVAEIVRLCGYLPLAISLLAGRWSHHPTWSLVDLIAELTAAKGRLTAIRAETRAVATAFDLSYRHLPSERQLLFRRLGLHPGADFDAYAAAALADLTLLEVQEHLERLYDEHILEEPIRGRYRMHDLVREYSRELASADDPTERGRAVERLFDYYQATAAAADQRIARDPRVAPTLPAHWPGAAPDTSTIGQALTWMRAEHANLLDSIRAARENGQNHRVIGLTSAIAGHLFHDGLYRPAIELHLAAISAAQAVGDHIGQAGALYDLGPMRYLTADSQGAIAALQQAVDIYRQANQPLGEANALKELGFAQYMTGNVAATVPMQRRAVALYRDLGQPRGEANALNYLGCAHTGADEYSDAVTALTHAVEIYREVDDRHGQADALDHLGNAWSCTGQVALSIQAYEQALPVFRDLGDRLRERNVLLGLADASRHMGQFDHALTLAGQALAICRDLGEWDGEAQALIQIAALRQLTGNPDEAIRILAAPVRFFQDGRAQLSLASALDQLGRAHHAIGGYAKANEHWQHALLLCQQQEERFGQAEVLNNLGTLALDLGDTHKAHDYHQQALSLAREIHAPVLEAHALRGLGRCALRANDIDTALRQLRHASEIYQQIQAYHAKELTAEITALTDRWWQPRLFRRRRQLEFK